MQAATPAGRAVEEDLVDDDDVAAVAAVADVGGQRLDGAVVVVDDQYPVAVQQQLATPALAEQHTARDGRLGAADVHNRESAVAHRDDAAPVGLDDVGFVHADHLHVRAGEVGSAGVVVATRDSAGGGGSIVGDGKVGLGSLQSDGAGPEDGPVPIAVEAVGPHTAHRLGTNVRQQGLAIVEVLQRRGELRVVRGVLRGGCGRGRRVPLVLDPRAFGHGKNQSQEGGDQ